MLLCCTVSEDDYYGIRREQRLLVDYGQFPYKLGELLQQCIAGASDDRRPATFMATLQTSTSASSVGSSQGMTGGVACTEEMDLIISEVTSFRQILHLQLRLRPPNDAVLRRHITDVIRRYQEEINQLRGNSGRTGKSY